MKRYFLHQPVSRILLGLTILIGFLFMANEEAYSQFDKPSVPYLSLTGQDGGYDKDWYPDGRVWIPTSGDSPREFLLPVWIENRWYTYPNEPRFIADPIYSFQFRVLYDSAAIRAIGVQKFGPRDEDNEYEPLAKNFNISWMDDRDTSKYKTYLNPGVRWQDKQKGRAIRIVGTSTSEPLPHTDLFSQEYKILLYIRFRIIPESGAAIGEGQNTPIIIDKDTIMYNDWNIREDNPFQKLYKNFVPGVQIYEPSDQTDEGGGITGLGGINNRNWGRYSIEPTKEGVIYLQITERPEFNFIYKMGAIPKLYQPDPVNEPEMWVMEDPITIDSASIDPLWGKRIIEVENGNDGTRMLDIEIETDEPWLKVQARRTGPDDKIPPDFAMSTRKGNIKWLDKGILGFKRDPYDEVSDLDGSLHLEIQCDPNQLTLDANNEKAGIYEGYITFKSSFAAISPVRIKVTFIYFRNPVEWLNPLIGPGIMLTVRNSRGVEGDICKLIFGTGHRATDGVDQLFGEFAYTFPLDEFGARFYPWNNPDLEALVEHGFGDWSPNELKPRTCVVDEDGNPRYGSRDIRSNFDTLQSIIYYVRFNAGGVENYPIVIEWDTTNFLEGSQLFLRDSINGSNFNVDMRKATPLGGGRFSYVIEDPRWTSFLIEYTLPRVIRYVDAFGDPIIQPGWNFLSMAVRPTNSFWKIFYPNAMNIPVKFTMSLYQQEEWVAPGVGYFIKYSDDQVDTTFAGTFISEIRRPFYPVRLYTGWNTIGSCSGPVNVDDLDIEPYNNNNRPSISITKAKGVYGYETNRGYKEVIEIKPGLGYWLYVDKGAWLDLEYIGGKVGFNGYINPKEEIIDRSVEITIRDAAQNEGTVYMISEDDVELNVFTLPPLPPVEMFDARFDNGAYMNNTNSTVIRLQGVDYPLSISMDRPDANYTFADPLTGEVFGTINKTVKKNVIIPSSKTNAVQVLKSGDATSYYALTNYPNPVENVSTIRFALPVKEHVTIKLYDAMGNEVEVLVDEVRNAGEHNDVRLNAAKLSSGSYICKLSAGSFNAARTITVVK